MQYAIEVLKLCLFRPKQGCLIDSAYVRYFRNDMRNHSFSDFRFSVAHNRNYIIYVSHTKKKSDKALVCLEKAFTRLKNEILPCASNNPKREKTPFVDRALQKNRSRYFQHGGDRETTRVTRTLNKIKLKSVIYR